MTASHLEFLVEEISTEAFLRSLLPRHLPDDRTFDIHAFQGKSDLIAKLEARLRGYSHWLPDDWRLIIIVDRDDDDCRALKQKLDEVAENAGLSRRGRGANWQLVNRIAVEEVEAWYFGDWAAVCTAYPRVAANVPAKRGFRDPDAVSGGTWEAFERILQRHGYFSTGLRKVEAARAVGSYVDPTRNTSRSFRCLYQTIVEAIE